MQKASRKTLLTILSYNIEYGKQYDQIVLWLKQDKVSPDIFCFQEFPEDKVADFKAFLREKGFSSTYISGQKIHDTQIGLLTAHRRKKLQLQSHKIVHLGNHAWERKLSFIKGDRVGLITNYRFNKTIFSLANIHLTVAGPNSMRYAQLKLITDALPKDQASLIVGDYNHSSLFGVRNLHAYMKQFGYSTDEIRLVTHKIFGVLPQQLDYLFTKQLLITDLRALKVPYSDHFPLVAKLTIKA